MSKKHPLPPALQGEIGEDAYARWLRRKAAAHVKRDRLRGRACTMSAYKTAIHQAVLASSGRDAYTGEKLDWHLISTYDNAASKAGKHGYKALFALLPTVDHIDASPECASFNVCAWRTNDAKNDLSHADFIDLCRRVLAHADHFAQAAE